MSRCMCLTSREVIALAAGTLTARQLHYWTGVLRIVPAHRHGRRTHQQLADRIPLEDAGAGTPIGWDRPDAERAAWIAQVTAATGLPPQHAAALHDGDLTVPTLRGTYRLTAHRTQAGAA